MSNAKGILFLLLTLIIGVASGFFIGCQSREIKMSPIEKMFETQPELATYALCQRAAGTKGHQGGVNVRDCDPFKEAYHKSQEFEKCKKSLGGDTLKDKTYTPEQFKNIINIKAVCYLVIYKRQAQFDAFEYKICKPRK